MDILIEIVIGGGIGFVVGSIFFSGLWWTVQRVAEVERPAVWLALSAVVRVLVVAIGLFMTLSVGPWALVAALLAFLIVRSVAIRRVGRLQEAEPHGLH
mgnify:CR=1 FL=1